MMQRRRSSRGCGYVVGPLPLQGRAPGKSRPHIHAPPSHREEVCSHVTSAYDQVVNSLPNRGNSRSPRRQERRYWSTKE